MYREDMFIVVWALQGIDYKIPWFFLAMNEVCDQTSLLTK